MPAPTPNWNLVPVRGKFIGFDGLPVTGRVLFTPRASRTVDAEELTTLIGRMFTATLVNGYFEIYLPAGDDPDLMPTGFTYQVKEEFSGGAPLYDIEVPLDKQLVGVNLALVAPSENITPTNPGITRVEFNVLSDAVDELIAMGGSGSDPLPAITSAYPLALTSANPNLFESASLPTGFTGGFTSINKNLDAAGPRHIRMAWTYHLAIGTAANLFLREYAGLNATGTELRDHEMNYDPNNATAAAPYRGVFEFEALSNTQSVALFYRSADGTTAVTVTEFDMRQVEQRADLIVTNIDPKTTGSNLGQWIIDIPAPEAGVFPTMWRARTHIRDAAALEMGVQMCELFVDDDSYANTGHTGYRGENVFDTLGTVYPMNLGNNDFILGVRVPSDITLDPGDALQLQSDGRYYLLRGNVHGGEKGRSGDVNADFKIYLDRLGDGNWSQVTGPAVLRRCRAVKFTAQTKVYDANTPSRIEVDKTYIFYPDGTFRQDRVMRFLVDTYWCQFFVNMSSYDPSVPLVGKIGRGQVTERTVDYHGVGAAVVDDSVETSPGGWGVYVHPTAPVAMGQAVDPEQLLASPRVTGTKLLARRYQSGAGTKFYQLLYADPDTGAGHPPFDGDDTVGTGANFFPAGTVLTTRHWGFLYQPGDATYFDNEAKAIGGRVPEISVRYPVA